MEILLSNDDGYLAPGLRCLTDVLADVGRVTVVAPDRERSGASNSLTLETPLRVHRQGEARYSVNGTPTDCVHLAITGLLDRVPDLVVSGINHGANLGDDVHYSGTVAAAMEGRSLGLPAIAVSLVLGEHHNFEAAARVVAGLLARMADDPLPGDTILNVNVPDVPPGTELEIEVCRLGQRHRAEGMVASEDPKGRRVYWVGQPGAGADAGPGTDFHTVAQGRVAVTPLSVDLTRHDQLAPLKGWLEGAV